MIYEWKEICCKRNMVNSGSLLPGAEERDADRSMLVAAVYEQVPEPGTETTSRAYIQLEKQVERLKSGLAA